MAVVGATVWRNLRVGAIAGPVFSENPKHAELDGETVFATAAEAPRIPDLEITRTAALIL